jgi:hypothetical protein
MKINTTNLIISAGLITILMTPIGAYAATFEDPLNIATDQPAGKIVSGLIGEIIMLLTSIAAVLAFLAIVISGIRLIMVPWLGEKEAVKAKQVLFWAILGLLVIGVSALIVMGIEFILGLPDAVTPVDF